MHILQFDFWVVPPKNKTKAMKYFIDRSKKFAIVIGFSQALVEFIVDIKLACHENLQFLVENSVLKQVILCILEPPHQFIQKSYAIKAN